MLLNQTDLQETAEAPKTSTIVFEGAAQTSANDDDKLNWVRNDPDAALRYLFVHQSDDEGILDAIMAD